MPSSTWVRPPFRSTGRVLAVLVLAILVLTGLSAAQGRPALAAAAKPTADNTGVPDGTRLTPPSGTLTITTDGTVVSGVDLTGCVVIQADDVVIKNSRIRCGSSPSGAAVQVASGATGAVLVDSEVDGRGTIEIGVGFGNIRVTRVEIHRAIDGVRAGSYTTLENSWVHDLVRVGSYHGDAVQSTGGGTIVIRYNSLDPRNDATGDMNNSAIQLGSEIQHYLRAVQVTGNWINGGNFSVNVRGDVNASNVVFRSNRFGDTARYGPAQAPSGISIDSSNVMSPSGTPIRVSRI